MNRYEKRATEGRKSNLRSSMTMWSAGAALAVVVLLILGLSSAAPAVTFKKGAVAAAVLLLVLRQVNRVVRKRTPNAVKPDPQSRLNLD